jgi:antitoxin VapB
MSGPRHVRLFRNGRNQAVRIPVEFELPGDEAIMHRDGDRLIIEPVRKRGLLALLDTMEPVEEPFPDIDDPAVRPEKIL